MTAPDSWTCECGEVNASCRADCGLCLSPARGPQQAGGEDYSALKTRLRDSAMLSTMPEWCRKELEQGADAIAALQAEVARLLGQNERLASAVRDTITRAETAEAALREADAASKEPR